MARPTVVALGALAPIAWGSTYVVTSELLPGGQPMTAAVLRAVPAGFLLLALAARLPPQRWWWRATVLAVLNVAVFFPLLFVAAYRLPGGVAAVVASIGPFLAAGLAMLCGERRPARGQLGWAAIGMVGVVLVAAGGARRIDLVGVAAAFAGAVSMTAGTVLAHKWRAVDEPGVLALTGWQLMVGGLLLVPLVPVFDTRSMEFDARAGVGYVYLSLVCTAAAYCAWTYAVREMEPTEASLLVRLTLPSALILGWLWAGQGLEIVQLVGVALVVSTTVLGQGRGPGVRDEGTVSEVDIPESSIDIAARTSGDGSTPRFCPTPAA